MPPAFGVFTLPVVRQQDYQTPPTKPQQQRIGTLHTLFSPFMSSPFISSIFISGRNGLYGDSHVLELGRVYHMVCRVRF